MDTETFRKKFEEMFAHPPYEMNIERWACNRHEAQNVGDLQWPGQYKNYETQIAWSAFIEGINLGHKHSPD